ncbi:MAG: TlpA family protein disulfide reductase [Gammaproteobacteria bacterium]|nr:TlpA family protein disulfide reductase [Gammaproteobacteria bacterium]
MLRKYFYSLCTVSLLFLSPPLLASQLAAITLSSGNEISYSQHKAEGNTLLLWFYSEAGPQASDQKLARELARSGTEVWVIDLFSSYFLPVALSSMDTIPAADISDLIEMAHKKTAKNVIAVTTGRSAIPLLRGARQWQISQPASKALSGLILISPKFYTETPEPGLPGKLMPVVHNSNLLLFIIQAKESPWFWKLERTVAALQQAGSDVFLKLLAGVRDRFYFRADADAYEQQLTNHFSSILNQAITALKQFPDKNRAVSSLALASPAVISSKQDKSLRPHKANSTPAQLRLKSVTNQTIDLQQFKNTVVLVNFWASWCPPCVHEMPSMQRLQNQFTEDKFVILGVNMAEEKTVIEDFLTNKVNVSFPILMDTDGAALKRWQVFAFPTSYLIDKKGKIRYSLFGSIEWDNPHTLSIIHKLVNE